VRLPRCADRQFLASFGWMCVTYAVLITVLVSVSWWAGAWAAAALFLFLAWAYRWPIGVKLGLCARRPGALPSPSSAPGDARE
jgi:hypothetical protein